VKDSTWTRVSTSGYKITNAVWKIPVSAPILLPLNISGCKIGTCGLSENNVKV
jgi:hypothetical protein